MSYNWCRFQLKDTSTSAPMQKRYDLHNKFLNQCWTSRQGGYLNMDYFTQLPRDLAQVLNSTHTTYITSTPTKYACLPSRDLGPSFCHLLICSNLTRENMGAYYMVRGCPLTLLALVQVPVVDEGFAQLKVCQMLQVKDPLVLAHAIAAFPPACDLLQSSSLRLDYYPSIRTNWQLSCDNLRKFTGWWLLNVILVDKTLLAAVTTSLLPTKSTPNSASMTWTLREVRMLTLDPIHNCATAFFQFFTSVINTLIVRSIGDLQQVAQKLILVQFSLGKPEMLRPISMPFPVSHWPLS